MSDEKALLAAIWDQPHEDTPRLVYGDWLQETDDPANVGRAEFIRLQCEHARTDLHDPRRVDLDRDAARLFVRFAKEWARDAPGCIRRLRNTLAFDRGFPRPGRELNLHMFRATTAHDWAAAPLWKLDLVMNKPRDRELVRACVENPHLFRLRELELRCSWIGRGEQRWQPEDVVTLMRCPFARNVAELTLNHIPVGPAAVAALADAAVLPHLTKLHLKATGVTAELLAALSATPLASRIASLDISANRFGDDGARVLASLPPLPALRDLRLGQNWFTEAGYAALAAWPGLAMLYWLDLGSRVDRTFTPAAARAFADSPHVGRLWSLMYPDPGPGPGTDVRDILRQRFERAYAH
jgi:uncharacterized protein (TIGR02996 family)